MRDPKRISKFMTTVKDLWRLNPDLRFGQLILNVIQTDKEDLFYIEDDVLLERLIKFYSGSDQMDEMLNNILNNKGE